MRKRLALLVLACAVLAGCGGGTTSVYVRSDADKEQFIKDANDCTAYADHIVSTLTLFGYDPVKRQRLIQQCLHDTHGWKEL